MDGFEIVRQLKARRTAIFERHLPHESIAEIEEIEAAIRQIDALLRVEGDGVDVPVPARFAGTIDETVKPKRVPLRDRSEELYIFLMRHGPATRAEILDQTDIPPGTLSAVLANPPFTKLEGGKWGVYRKVDYNSPTGEK